MKIFRLLLVVLVAITPARAQEKEDVALYPPVVRLDGPRFGITYIDGPLADSLERSFGTIPIISQFGWQFESRFFTMPNGSCGIIEFVGLIGGVDQNLFLPSATVLVGMRNSSGMEFGFGPNISLAGTAVAFAAGITVQSYGINFPINLAYVPSRAGGRFSMLFGFNAGTRPPRRVVERESNLF